MRDNGRNPYEIRADLLESARAILFDSYTSLVDQWRNCVGRTSDGQALEPCPHTPPTTDEVVEAASRLYLFVAQNDRQENKKPA
jgi:hypothetical protein